jgi:hypothetical protein
MSTTLLSGVHLRLLSRRAYRTPYDDVAGQATSVT